MNQPPIEVADIVRACGARFMERSRRWLHWSHVKVLNAIARCRSAALGGHRDQCPNCGHQAISYNSCRNRHCPKCQTAARDRWVAKRQTEVLPVGYFHVVFTLPHELSALALQNKKEIYRLLLQVSADTLLEVAANPKHLGASIGFLSILHTWGQNLLLHPHVHCVVPGGGISPDQTRWIHSRPNFLLPVPVLKIVFRAKVRDGLKRLFRAGKLVFVGELADLSRWNRFLSFDGESVTFRWKDYAHGNKKRKMTISADEFLRRFLLHTLPRGFVRIRFFGFMAGPRRSRMLQLARRLLETGVECGVPPTAPTPTSYQCPVCATPMIFIERLTAAMVRRAVAAHQDAINDSSQPLPDPGKRAMGFGSHATFVVTKLPTLGPNTRRNLAAFPIASRVRRKRQRLRSNRLIESAAARFHISRYSSAAALPISPSVSRPVAQFPRAPSSDRNLTAGRTLAGPLSPFRRCRWLRAHRCNSLACTIEEGPQTLVRSDGSN